jgi:transposase
MVGGIASWCLIRLGRARCRIGFLLGQPVGGGMVAQGGERSPFAVTLTASQRRFLKRLVRRPTAQQRQVTRARIVLLAAAGLANAAIARRLGIAPNTVGKWRKRFYTEGLDGLADRKRSGRPRAFPAAYVISADEKTSIQARCRCHPTLPPAEARSMRVEHEYERGGALAYLAAWDVHHARLFGRLEPITGIEPFDRLVARS